MRCIALCAFLLCSSIKAASYESLTVFAKGDITAECGDFLGRTAAQGRVTLRDFLVQDTSGRGCPLETASQLTMLRGSVQDRHGFSCVAAKTAKLTQTGYDGSAFGTVRFKKISAEIDLLSKSLSLIRFERAGLRLMELTSDELSKTRTLKLNANPHELLLINIRGKEISMQNMGIELNGGAGPGTIIWNFVDTEMITVNNTGTSDVIHGEEIGIPGMILAPQATLVGNSARVTGSLYVKNFIGMGSKSDCSGPTSLQVNPHPMTVGMPCTESCGGKDK